MQGKTHFAIGMATGAAMVLYAVNTNQPIIAAGMITTGMGAMLPDADHDMTHLGVKRKVVMKRIKQVCIVALVISALLIAYAFIGGGALESLSVLGAVVPTCCAVLVATSDTMKKKFPFFHKHRGIMHTLVIPAIGLFCASRLSIEIFRVLLLGLMLGYISHIVADSFTGMGTPMMWPISEICISFLDITTGTAPEYIVAVLLSSVIVAIGYFAGIGELTMTVVVCFVLAAAAGALLVLKAFKEFDKSKVKVIRVIGKVCKSPVIPLVVAWLGCTVAEGTVQVGMIGFTLGYCFGLASYLSKKASNSKKAQNRKK